MKIKLLYILILLFNFSVCQANSDNKSRNFANRDSSIYRNFISFNSTQLFISDFKLSYERFSLPRLSFSIELGYKPKLTSKASDFAGFTPNYIDCSTWLYASTGFRYYFDYNKILYINAEFFDSYKFFNYITYHHTSGESAKEYTSLRSRYTNTFGIKVIIGKRKLIGINDRKFKLYLDYYTGLGLRYWEGKITEYAINYGNQSSEPLHYYSTPNSNNIFYIMPSFQLGIRIGLAIK